MRRRRQTGPPGRPPRVPVIALSGILLLSTASALSACASLEQAIGDAASERTAAIESDRERAKQHLAARRHALAIEAFRSALENEPDSVALLNGLAAAYDGIGRHDVAARSYARALALEPGSAQTLNNMGYSYLLQRRYDLAVAYLRAAHAAARDDPIIAGNRRIAESALAKADLARSKRLAEQGAGPEPTSQRPGRRRPWIARTAPGVQTLITGQRAGWAKLGDDPAVDPRLAAYRLSEPPALEVAGPLAAPLARRSDHSRYDDGLADFLAAPLAPRDGSGEGGR